MPYWHSLSAWSLAALVLFANSWASCRQDGGRRAHPHKPPAEMSWACRGENGTGLALGDEGGGGGPSCLHLARQPSHLQILKHTYTGTKQRGAISLLFFPRVLTWDFRTVGKHYLGNRKNRRGAGSK